MGIQAFSDFRPSLPVLTEPFLPFDEACAGMSSNAFNGMIEMPRLGAYLEMLRSSASEEYWKQLVYRIRAHPCFAYLLEDPFTARSFEKPRGYSGDAVMLDYIYKHPSAMRHVDTATSMGREIYNYTTISPASAAVFKRRQFIADTLDTTLTPLRGQGRVLSVASGHLRELDISLVAQSSAIRQFVALDQDPETIRTVRERNYGQWLGAIQGSVKDLISGRIQLEGQFDFIYTAGLLDYLPDAQCVSLLAYLKKQLTGDGTLLVANFNKGIVDRGYMESCMDWWLIYRSEEDMRRIGLSAGWTPKTLLDSGRQIIYMQHSNVSMV